jgi:hypothetical protein
VACEERGRVVVATAEGALHLVESFSNSVLWVSDGLGDLDEEGVAVAHGLQELKPPTLSDPIAFAEG